jgi:replicative DNA helicase
MKLSKPLPRLKSQAKQLARAEGLTHLSALDRIAGSEGYRSWSMLAAQATDSSPAAALLSQLHPGDLVLIAARPGQGKTRLGIELAVQAAAGGRLSVFFTFEYSAAQLETHFAKFGDKRAGSAKMLDWDSSDAISADYIIDRMARAEAGALIVVDYLQLLDQKRDNPPLAEQVERLQAWARAGGSVAIFIAQIDRSYDPRRKPQPTMADIRLPNPLDIGLFDKICFLANGKMALEVNG